MSRKDADSTDVLSYPFAKKAEEMGSPVSSPTTLPAVLFLSSPYLATTKEVTQSLVAGLAAAPSCGPTWKISCNVFSVELWS
jgi:hypothetical protein